MCSFCWFVIGNCAKSTVCLFPTYRAHKSSQTGDEVGKAKALLAAK